MKCYICGTEMIPCITIYKSKEVYAMRCTNCDDNYTTVINSKDLKEVDLKIKAYMEHYNCTKEEAKKEIDEIEQQMINDFYSKYTGKQY